MIQAKVVADSKNKFDNRITTMIVTMPRNILSEFNTHRMFSRNSASSRAIPFEKLLKSVEENPFIPIAWQKDHKGMQGNEYFTDRNDIFRNEDKWRKALTHAISSAKWLHAGFPEDEASIGVTKQLCNRLLEPFMYHTVICTATEWKNFFALRCPRYEYGKLGARSIKDIISMMDEAASLHMNMGMEEDKLRVEESSILERLQHNKGQADIHMMATAEAMWDAMNESKPKELKAGEWHIPFGDDLDELIPRIVEEGMNPETTELKSLSKDLVIQSKLKVATARCARVSYTVVGSETKQKDYLEDVKLHDRLAASGHWSPFEHCAKAMTADEANYSPGDDTYEGTAFSGNIRGFVQYRKMFKNENITNV